MTQYNENAVSSKGKVINISVQNRSGFMIFNTLNLHLSRFFMLSIWKYFTNVVSNSFTERGDSASDNNLILSRDHSVNTK